MRLPFLMLSAVLLCSAAARGEDPQPPNIVSRPLTLGDISRFSNRLRDPDAAKAVSAARELAETRQPNAAKLLLDFYTGGDGERRMAAVKALGVLGDKSQGNALLNMSLHDTLAAVRRQAALELAQLEGNDAARQRYINVAMDGIRFSPVARNRAVHHGAIVGKARATPFLRAVLSGPDYDTAIAAAEELGEIRDSISVDELLQALKSQHNELKPAVVDALERLTGKNFQYDLVKWSEWRKSIELTPNGETVAPAAPQKEKYKFPESGAEKLPVDIVIAFDTTASFVHAWADVDRATDAVLRELVKTEPDRKSVV